MIEVICGPMYSGKSEELIRRLRRAEIGGKKVLLMRPDQDTRFEEDFVVSHSGIRFKAVKHSLLATFPMYLPKPWEGAVIGVDEAQFFDAHLIRDIKDANERGITVICAGLDMTFRREPFGIMPTLLAIADRVTKLSAVCHSCGEDAIYTQRLVNGNPAPFDGPTVLVGAIEAYEARCRQCFQIA